MSKMAIGVICLVILDIVVLLWSEMVIQGKII